MTLPDGFNSFEHLQQTYKTEFNRRVDIAILNDL
jgi:hypothetical protein